MVTGLQDTSAYYPLTEDEVAMLLGERGVSLGAFSDEGELIGYAAAYFPGSSPDNLGLDLGLCSDRLLQVAHLEAGLVSPFYRGRGWQRRLYQELIKGLIAQGKYRYILSTVACNNYPALHNSLRLKLYITELREKYGNMLRYVLFRDIKEPININPASVISCRHTDIELQHRLIRQGYYGFDVKYNTDSLVIYYGVKD